VGTSLSTLLAAPHQAATHLVREQVGVGVTRTLVPRGGGCVIDFRFNPTAELLDAGYCDERARVSVAPDGELYAFPLGPARAWKHRYPFQPTTGFCKQLCLWYPGDPRPLSWVWDDGFEDYVARVHRHLYCEEFWRREGRWPTEDAPHGVPAAGFDGLAGYPIYSEHLRRAVAEHRLQSPLSTADPQTCHQSGAPTTLLRQRRSSDAGQVGARCDSGSEGIDKVWLRGHPRWGHS
jgi:hypothetical protein